MPAGARFSETRIVILHAYLLYYYLTPEMARNFFSWLVQVLATLSFSISEPPQSSAVCTVFTDQPYIPLDQTTLVTALEAAFPPIVS